MKKLLLGIALTGLALILCFPVWFGITGAFSSQWELEANLAPVFTGTEDMAAWSFLPQAPTLEPLVQVLMDAPEFFVMFWNSVAITFGILAGQLLADVPAAWALAQLPLPQKGKILSGYIVLMLMPFQVLMYPQYLVIRDFGLLDTLGAVIFPAVFSTFPVFLLHRFFLAIPGEILEAARIDGAGELRIFWQVGIPLGKPGIMAVGILSFLDSWNLIERPMVMLSTGQLRVALKDNNNDILICTGGEEPGQWQSTENLPEDITASGGVEALALSPEGSIFCSTVQEMEDGTYQYHFWVIDAAGACREIPITYPDLEADDGYLVSSYEFTDSGRLFVAMQVQDVREVNLETGELSENLNDAGFGVLDLESAGEDVYLLGWSQAAVWNEDSGFQPLTGVLEEQVIASLKATEGTSPEVTFWKNSQGYLLFTTHEGLYSYVPDGSVTEELVSGTGTSLADPAFCPTVLTGGADDSFYVLGKQNGQPALYRYVYDPNVPTEPSTHLTVYSLYPQDTLMQLISQYQKAHPDTAVTLEVGLTGEDGVTEADAIRTLNTRILAEDGPDLICLDGFNLNTYQEKGLLADVTQILDQGEKTLEQVTKCYADEGKVSMVPTAFAIPVVYGLGEIISQIQDLDSLMTAAGLAKEAKPEANSVFNAWIPEMFADIFYDSCSAAWFREDGTLDGEALTQYYTAMQNVYALDGAHQEKMREMLESEGRSMEDMGYVPGEYTGLGGSITMFSANSCLDAGTLESMESWSYALAEVEGLEGYQVLPLNAQASNVFLPRRVMGILTSSTQQEAAAQFLAFLLSEEAQSSAQGFGFPVNQAAFDRQITENRTSDTSATMSDDEGNIVTFNFHYPEAELRQQFKTWADQLTTPASTDRIIRSMVIEQAAACLNGELTPQQASDAALQALNLYLTE